MDARERRTMAALKAADVPEPPGVYALYRDGRRMYVGKADCLRDRVWKDHSGRGAVMTGSALRRNIAERPGIASSADIKARRYQPTPDEALAVRAWLDGCDIAWVECDTNAAAKALEDNIGDGWHGAAGSDRLLDYA
jgi:hypothetical protein